MHYICSHIEELIQADRLNASLYSGVITQVCIDSRQITFPKASLFFALKGNRRDGHQFLKAAYQSGIRNFVIEKDLAPTEFPEANLFKVANSLDALQQLAQYHRKQFQPLTIGITGSNGKTIVKEWLYQLLADQYRIVRSPRSYNSQIGVPLSVLQLARQHELALFEAGISQTGEMDRLAPIIDCQLGILTYLGDAHRQGFANKAEKLREKLLLFRSASHLIYSADQPEVDRIVHEVLPKIIKLSWSSGEKGFLSKVSWKPTSVGSRLQAIFEGNTIQLEIPFEDQASQTNAVHCLCVLLHLGYPPEEAQPLLKKLEAVAMRLEMKAGINQTTVINDAYNADLASLSIALQFLDQQNPQGRRTLILSDLLETGYAASDLYAKVADLIKAKKVDRLIAIGQEVQRLETSLPSSIATSFYRDTDDFLHRFHPADYQRETILLKGARAFTFERIADRLALKAHNTVLEINLNALKHNLEFFHQHLHSDTKVLVMVKAGAYGSGAFEIARLLEFQRVDYLGVAYADEGIELRKAGISLPILVLNPEEASFPAMKRYRLEPEIYSLRVLQQWLDSGVHHDHPGIHLKLETGMNRLGFSVDDLPLVIELLQDHPEVRVLSVFSHLAASEDARSDGFTHQQAMLFQQMATLIPGSPDRHILNSSGILRFPEYQFEMVRLGIGIYGIESSGAATGELETVFCLKALLSQVRDVNAGDTIGYGRRGEVRIKSRIGVVSIGYADGLLRLAGNGRYALQIRGKDAPILGNVCMDMCMVDLSAIPEAKEGDEVLVFGGEKTVEELAVALQTIPYEIFTNISPRVKRVYVQE